MKYDDLFDITLNVLGLIINLYEEKKISYKTFVENSKKKIAFINQFLETAQQDEIESFSHHLCDNMYKAKCTLLVRKYASLVKDKTVTF